MLNTFITGEVAAEDGVTVPPLPSDPADDVFEIRGPSGLQVWVKNLPFETTDEELRTYFEQVGAVESCDIQRTGGGRSKGTAIIRFLNSSDAMKAVELLDGSTLGSREIHVRLDRRG